MEYSSTNNTFFQISILSSRIEIIEFSSISRNQTKHKLSDFTYFIYVTEFVRIGCYLIFYHGDVGDFMNMIV